MAYVVKMENLEKSTPGAGTKAGILGELYNANMAVPPGFVVTADSLLKFLKANRIQHKIQDMLKDINPSDYRELREKSVEIQNMILNGNMPDYIEHAIKEEYEELSIGREAKEIGGIALDLIKAGRGQSYVSVRSSPYSEESPYATFSGQTKSFMNVQGHSSICNAVRQCWASLFTPRALLYRKIKRIHDFPVMGVIIQKMIESEKAGWMFTSQPEKDDHSRMVIESSWGLGEAISSGIVTPDEFLVDKENGGLVSSRVRKKSWMNRRDAMSGRTVKETVPRERVERTSLEQEEVKRLWATAMKVERHFNGQAQEIEWAIERGRIMILQSDPLPNYGISRSEEAALNGNEKELAGGTVVSHGTAKGKARVILAMSELQDFSKGEIIVTKMTNPDMVRFVRDAAGMITDEGGRTSHAARLCRELGIPCIVGCGNATSSVQDGGDILIDTLREAVYGIPEPEPVPHEEPAGMDFRPNVSGEQYHPPQSQDSIYPQRMEDIRESHRDGITATGIRAVLSFPERVNDTVGKCEGVGLVKPEYMIADKGKHSLWLARNNPEELIDMLVDGLRKIARPFYPKPVWYRLIDVRTDEFRDLEGGDEEPTENNPMMGWHGIRRSLDEQDILRCEIEALVRLRREGLDNIMIAIPFVSRLEEIRRVREGIRDLPIKIGITLETPAAAMDIESLCREGISFVSIGMDELTQLSVGADKDNPKTSRIFSDMNPGVINLLRQVISACRKNNVETSAYGSIENNPDLVERLVGMGVSSITAEPEYLDSLKETISRSERKMLLDRARGQSF